MVFELIDGAKRTKQHKEKLSQKMVSLGLWKDVLTYTKEI